MSTTPLTIVAKITAKADCIKEVEAELQKIIEPTLAEEGCIEYILHRDNKNPNVFLFYENWSSYELWQQHMKSPHLEQFSANTEGKLEDVEILEMTKL